MKKLRWLPFLVLFMSGSLLAKEPKEDAGKKATPAYQASLIEGLKLIQDEKWDTWIADYCSKEKLCTTPNAIASLKRYNLPAMKRRVDRGCLKEGNKIAETRLDGDPSKDSQIKVFIECETTAMPVPFRLIKEDGKWLFQGI